MKTLCVGRILPAYSATLHKRQSSSVWPPARTFCDYQPVTAPIPNVMDERRRQETPRASTGVGLRAHSVPLLCVFARSMHNETLPRRESADADVTGMVYSSRPGGARRALHV